MGWSTLVIGGLAGAPKFPNAPFMDPLWLSWLRTVKSAIEMRFCVSGLCCRGEFTTILAGDFPLRSGRSWLVPHFEKMLYDNAQFIRHATFGFAETGDELFRFRIEETVAWLQREMLVDGRFASSLDADSEGEEGRFYVWTAGEIPGSSEFDAFRRVYDVSDQGNWEGKSILNRLHSLDALDLESEKQLKQARQALFALRESVFVLAGTTRH